MTRHRKRGSAPAYCKHKATGQAIVRLNGRDFYLGVHGTRASIDAYDALIGEWLANGRRLPEESVTINELIVRYMEHAEGYYRKDGVPTFQSIASARRSGSCTSPTAGSSRSDSDR